MSAYRFTRRSLLVAGAGALAGGLLRPLGAVAAPGGTAVAVSSRPLGRLTGPVTVELGGVADMVGVQWAAPADAAVELRFRVGGGWSRWVSAGARGHGPDAPAQRARVLGEPVWTGGTRAVQLRPSRALEDARLYIVQAGRGAARAARALPLATPVLAAGAGQPPIIARRAWALGACRPRVAPGYGAVRMAFVHHTDNPNGYGPGEVPAMLRAIYAYHRYANGWNDIGYNFVLDLYGRIFEARAGGIAEPVVGAQAGGYNLVSTGIAVLGTFSSEPISAAARRALERLLAWKLALHGIPAQGRVTVTVDPAGAVYSRFPADARVSLPRIAGHRDADATDCPGDVLYGELGGVRAAVARLAPQPTLVTLAPAAQAGGARAVTASVQLLDGTPIAGAPVLLQARSVSARGEVVREQAIAEGATGSEGGCTLPLATAVPARGLAVRALFAGDGTHGAGVSEPLLLEAAPSPPPAPAPTPGAGAPPAS